MAGRKLPGIPQRRPVDKSGADVLCLEAMRKAEGMEKPIRQGKDKMHGE
jgi:hypothetical protein